MNKIKNNLKHKSNSKKKIQDLIDIGKYIKIINSEKTYQVIGINKKKDICWVREWPLNFSSYKTFALTIDNKNILNLCEIKV